MLLGGAPLGAPDAEPITGEVPEGPSIVILREQLAHLRGRKILRAEGNAKIPMSRLVGQRILALRSWGKHFLVELPGFSVRVHFLMFGSYTIDERKDREPRLRLAVRGSEVNFYSCAIRLVEGDLDDTYDWSADVMSDAWDATAARRKLRAMPDAFICDALLDQSVFSGVGNIIKNEVLFRVREHPLSRVGLAATGEVARHRRTGAAVQLRLPGMEACLRAAQALAGAQQGHLPCLRRQADAGMAGQDGSPQLLLRALPEAAWAGA